MQCLQRYFRRYKRIHMENERNQENGERFLLPFEYIIENLTTSPMLNYFKNSIIITVGVLIPLLLISFMAGFALSKIQFRGNKKILSYFLLGLMLPFQVALIPLFTIFSKLGILNTYPAVILPQIAFSLSYSIQLYYSFSKFLPDEIIEAAIIDGCSPMRTFFKIVFPMSTNSLLTVATMQGVFTWNDFINAYEIYQYENCYVGAERLCRFYGNYRLGCYICGNYRHCVTDIFVLFLYE